MPTVINGTTGITFTDNTIQNTAAINFRNRIINGNMRIDQRNAGASVSFASSVSGFPVDRFQVSNVTDGAWTGQRSTVTPIGFSNSLLMTVTTADTSLGATQFTSVQQLIEGFNVADLGWGTANAQTVTLSFWVRSSLTGTFGGAFVNSAQNRSYPFTYTINSANTFEYKTVTVAGDTSGTWLTDNGIGVRIYFGLGVGATYSGTSGAWAGSLFISATGATSVIGTNGATFYITGVQLERGTTASSFDFRSHGAELALCQRYYQKSFAQGTAAAQNAGTNVGTLVANQPVSAGSTAFMFSVRFFVTMRTTPTTITTYNPAAANAQVRNTSIAADCTNTTVSLSGDSGFGISATTAAGSTVGTGTNQVHWSADAEL